MRLSIGGVLPSRYSLAQLLIVRFLVNVVNCLLQLLLKLPFVCLNSLFTKLQYFNILLSLILYVKMYYFITTTLSLSLSTYVCVYIYMCVFVYVCVYHKLHIIYLSIFT